MDLRTELDDGLTLQRQTCPIGVLLIIFEARPEVIANIASLAIKSANAAILKGGKESTESFKAISTVISQALDKTDVPNDSVQMIATRDVVDQLLSLSQYVDLVIPRGLGLGHHTCLFLVTQTDCATSTFTLMLM